MFTGPVGPVEVFFYWPEAVLGNFYWPGAIGLPLASSPVIYVFRNLMNKSLELVYRRDFISSSVFHAYSLMEYFQTIQINLLLSA